MRLPSDRLVSGNSGLGILSVVTDDLVLVRATQHLYSVAFQLYVEADVV